MYKYLYEVDNVDNADLLKKLNKRGLDGWCLISTHYYYDYNDKCVELIFKKEVQENE